jgi:hypothetical protein
VAALSNLGTAQAARAYRFHCVHLKRPRDRSDYASAHCNLANAPPQWGRETTAEHFRLAVIDPGSLGAHNNLGSPNGTGPLWAIARFRAALVSIRVRRLIHGNLADALASKPGGAMRPSRQYAGRSAHRLKNGPAHDLATLLVEAGATAGLSEFARHSR